MAELRHQNLPDRMKQIWQPVVDTLDWHRSPDTYLAAASGRRLARRVVPLRRHRSAVEPVGGRHQEASSGRIAIHWEGEPGDRGTLTYGELEREVALMSAALQDLGVGAEDTVAFYTGWQPETVVTLLACIGLGAQWIIVPMSIHSEALAERLALIAPKVLVTQDGAWAARNRAAAEELG